MIRTSEPGLAAPDLDLDAAGSIATLAARAVQIGLAIYLIPVVLLLLILGSVAIAAQAAARWLSPSDRDRAFARQVIDARRSRSIRRPHAARLR